MAAGELDRFVELAVKAKPLQVLAGVLHSRRTLADDDLLACAALVCLRGGLGVPGGGLNFLGVSPFPGRSRGAQRQRPPRAWSASWPAGSPASPPCSATATPCPGWPEA